MSATEKMVLVDAKNSDLIPSFISSQTEADEKNFKAESIAFLISGGRVEMPGDSIGLFARYVAKGLSGGAATHWKQQENTDSEDKISYVASKSLEGYLKGNMSAGNLQFDLNSYSIGVDFPITYVTGISSTVDTIPPMIYIPNAVSSEGKRGGRTKLVAVKDKIGGQALDESGLKSILVNGHEVPFTQNGKFELNQKFIGNQTKLVITATDNRGNMASDSSLISKVNDYVDPSLLNKEQTNHALLFATSHFDDPNWQDLANPLKDVRAIEQRLRDNYGFQVTVAIDYTVEQMGSILSAFTQGTLYSPKDQLLVYFAGHGMYKPDGIGGYVVAKNSIYGASTRSYLSFIDIRNRLNGPNACKHVLTVMDICFGGTFFDKKEGVTNYAGSDLKYIQTQPDSFINNKLKLTSKLFITSGGLEYVPDNSHFAKRFLETLDSKGVNKKGILTFNDFTDNLSTLELLPEEFRTSPRYGTFGDHEVGGEFILRYQERAKPKTHIMTKGEITTGR